MNLANISTCCIFDPKSSLFLSLSSATVQSGHADMAEPLLSCTFPLDGWRPIGGIGTNIEGHCTVLGH